MCGWASVGAASPSNTNITHLKFFDAAGISRSWQTVDVLTSTSYTPSVSNKSLRMI